VKTYKKFLRITEIGSTRFTYDRVFIPKDELKDRPLGVPTME
jgi:hypothetical protein